jgi:hypothetical protein
MAIKTDKKKFFLVCPVPPSSTFVKEPIVFSSSVSFVAVIAAYFPDRLKKLDKSADHKTNQTNYHKPGFGTGLFIYIAAQVISNQYGSAHHQAKASDY